jgi:hypothetical protein
MTQMASPIGPAWMIATGLGFLHLPISTYLFTLPAGVAGRRPCATTSAQLGPSAMPAAMTAKAADLPDPVLPTAGCIQRDPDAARARSGKLVSGHWSREAGQELP